LRSIEIDTLFCNFSPLQELSRSVTGYRRDALLTPLFWDWLLATVHCCGVGEEGWAVWKTAQLKV
jgi:hypothetical protein